MMLTVSRSCSTTELTALTYEITRARSLRQQRQSCKTRTSGIFAALCPDRIGLDALPHSAGAMPLFGLRRIRVTDKASKRAVHAFGCRDEPMPLAVDCSPNTKRRSFLVLCVRPGQTPLSVC